VDRKKPSLTSPWKVGFLVALLLVLTSLGVSYFITGTFGITWHWIHIGGASPASWTFNIGAFAEEMAPLLLLTSLLAFGAYVLVAGAVRRYKAYVDSGADYKQLLKSIKSIEDLEDDALVDQLKQHPELREFMMSIKHRVAAFEKQNAGRERRSAASPAGDREDRPRLPSEAAMLASAIASGRDALANELALTVPELKQIERAAREAFGRTPDAPVPAPVVLDTASKEELEALRAAVRAAAQSIRGDVDACASGAREVEAALTGLHASLQKSTPAAPAPNTAAVHKRVNATAEALVTLGEDTRRIAIAAALQASGGPDVESIKVADELRALATRFNSLAQHWRETASALQQVLGAAAEGRSAAPDQTAATTATIVSRARLWSERTVALTETVRALERAVGVSRAATQAPAAPAASTPAMDLADDAVPERETARSPEVRPAPETRATNEFITRTSEEMLAPEDAAETAFADIPGFEKESRIFADAAENETADERFVVDRGDDGRWDLSAEADEAAGEEAAPAAAPKSSPDADGFLTGPRPVVSPRKADRGKAGAPSRGAAPEPQPAAVATATVDAHADAVDLYDLGAVDCVQTV
jgi:HAMP domain-containing protein